MTGDNELQQNTRRESQSLGGALHHLAGAEADQAIAWLDRTDAEPALAVHECRKSAKRLRALARLAKHRHHKAFRRADKSLRRAGRSLARLRDAAVAVSTAESLHPELANDEFRTKLHARAIGRRAGEASARRARKALRKARGQMASLFPETDDWTLDELETGLRNQYGRFRRDALAWLESQSVDDAHKCRRNLQRHLNQLRLLPGLGLAGDERRIEALNALSQKLGLHHDLTVLRALIRRSRKHVHKVTGKTLRRIARDRQREIDADVADRLPSLIAPEPTDFCAVTPLAGANFPLPVAVNGRA